MRLLGVDLPRNKKIYVALTAIYGIGYKTSHKILRQININPNCYLKDLNDEKLKDLRNNVESNQYTLEGDLKRVINQNVKRLISIGSYRGRRHIKGLPARGQRSRTNSRTSRLVKRYTIKRK